MPSFLFDFSKTFEIGVMPDTQTKQSAQFAQTAFGYYIEYFVFLCCLLYREHVNPDIGCFL